MNGDGLSPDEQMRLFKLFKNCYRERGLLRALKERSNGYLREKYGVGESIIRKVEYLFPNSIGLEYLKVF